MSELVKRPATQPSAKRKVVVISQSMYFPWCGLLEQARMADVFVHYDDVQFARGFFNRVQVKTEHGIKWLSVPLSNQHRGQTIDECQIDSTNWQSKHRETLRAANRNAPFLSEMLAVVDGVFTERYESLGSLARATISSLVRAFDLPQPIFVHSAELGVSGSSSRRLLDITTLLEGNVYLTGRGALNYLDHSIFEERGIEVRYMDYSIGPWAQNHGEFTPFVTALDTLACLGPLAATALHSSTIHWREAIERHRELSTRMH
jgi:hypothetical protein